MYGSHLSSAGGIHNAVTSAVRLGLDTVQVFTHAPAQWAVKRSAEGAWDGKPIDPSVVHQWKASVNAAGFAATVAHDSYLINLASADPELFEKSVSAFAWELRRCESAGISFLVTHPGAHLGSGEDAGISRVIEGLGKVFLAVASKHTTVCLEVTAGQGSSLGYRLEHLRDVIQGCGKHARHLAVCLDTAHLLAAGYDFRGRKYAAFKRELDRTVGVDRVKVWHLNDSKKDLGSRVDRHEHIGHGFVGLDGFRPIVRDTDWAEIPKILETAKEKHPDGREWDEVNLETLRGLGGRSVRPKRQAKK
jgi:deoxyribonuclease-4